MTTTSFGTEEDFTEMVEPEEDLMLTREGFDRQSLRREIMPTQTIDRGTRQVEEGDGYYVSAKSDMPTGSTAVGEVMGNVDIERYVGNELEVPRMTHSMGLDAEDLEIDGQADKIGRSRDAVMEMFDIQADLQTLLGITDEEGNLVRRGVFDWLDDNIPADNVINAADFTTDFGLSNDGQPSNIVQQTAYGKLEGIYANDGWDQVFMPHNVRSLWNTIDDNSGVSLQSQWLDMNADAAGVGSSVVNDMFLIPNKTGLRTAPDASGDPLRFDIKGALPTASNGADDDVMYLIPEHDGDFYQSFEQSEPTLIQDPIRKNGGRQEYEYYWRAGHGFGLGTHRIDDGSGGQIAYDAIKIENVSQLF